MTEADQKLAELRDLGRSMVAYMNSIPSSIHRNGVADRRAESVDAIREPMRAAALAWQQVCQIYADATGLRYPPRSPNR